MNRMREYKWGRLEYEQTEEKKMKKLRLLQEKKVWYSLEVFKDGKTGKRTGEKVIEDNVWKLCNYCNHWGYVEDKNCYRKACLKPYGDDGKTRW